MQLIQNCLPYAAAGAFFVLGVLILRDIIRRVRNVK